MFGWDDERAIEELSILDNVRADKYVDFKNLYSLTLSQLFLPLLNLSQPLLFHLFIKIVFINPNTSRFGIDESFCAITISLTEGFETLFLLFFEGVLRNSDDGVVDDLIIVSNDEGVAFSYLK